MAHVRIEEGSIIRARSHKIHKVNDLAVLMLPFMTIPRKLFNPSRMMMIRKSERSRLGK